MVQQEIHFRFILQDSLALMESVIEFAKQTPDGAWRVDLVREGRSRRNRIINGENELFKIIVNSHLGNSVRSA